MDLEWSHLPNGEEAINGMAITLQDT